MGSTQEFHVSHHSSYHKNENNRFELSTNFQTSMQSMNNSPSQSQVVEFQTRMSSPNLMQGRVLRLGAEEQANFEKRRKNASLFNNLVTKPMERIVLNGTMFTEERMMPNPSVPTVRKEVKPLRMKTEAEELKKPRFL